MKRGYILFYDSGIGGLTTLKKAIDLLPREKFLYFADDKNCPYGNKGQKEIENIVEENLKGLLKQFCIKAVVFACNTVTTCCVEHLRKQYNLDFVGTEPAVLPALRSSKTKEVLVIATNATFRQEKYKKLVESAEGIVHSLGFSCLARDIEQKTLEGKSIDLNIYIGKITKELKLHPNIDSLVLGCTHYCYYSSIFEKRLGINAFNGNDGVAKRLVTLISRGEKQSDIDFKGKVDIMLSSRDKAKINKYYQLLRMIK